MGTARGVREATSDSRNDAAAADRVPHAHCRRRGAGCPVASSPNLSPPRALPAAKRNDPDFFIGNRVRTCISDDVNEAKAMLRKTMANYWAMPNYRNYWKEAGYLDEINAAEAAIAAGRTDELPRYLTDRWLADCTLYGPAVRIREGVGQWRDAGITTSVLVPLSPDGNQMGLAQVSGEGSDDGGIAEDRRSGISCLLLREACRSLYIR